MKWLSLLNINPSMEWESPGNCIMEADTLHFSEVHWTTKTMIRMFFNNSFLNLLTFSENSRQAPWHKNKNLKISTLELVFLKVLSPMIQQRDFVETEWDRLALRPRQPRNKALRQSWLRLSEPGLCPRLRRGLGPPPGTPVCKIDKIIHYLLTNISIICPKSECRFSLWPTVV